jgi:hypothetical protein
VKDNFKVDRRSIPVLSTAQDLLQGRVPESLPDEIGVFDEEETPLSQPSRQMWDDDDLEGLEVRRARDHLGLLYTDMTRLLCSGGR